MPMTGQRLLLLLEEVEVTEKSRGPRAFLLHGAAAGGQGSAALRVPRSCGRLKSGLSQPRAHLPLSQHCPYSSHTCPRQPPSRFHASSLPRPGTMVSVELVPTPVCSQDPLPSPSPQPLHSHLSGRSRGGLHLGCTCCARR